MEALEDLMSEHLVWALGFMGYGDQPATGHCARGASRANKQWESNMDTKNGCHQNLNVLVLQIAHFNLLSFFWCRWLYIYRINCPGWSLKCLTAGDSYEPTSVMRFVNQFKKKNMTAAAFSVQKIAPRLHLWPRRKQRERAKSTWQCGVWGFWNFALKQNGANQQNEFNKLIFFHFLRGNGNCWLGLLRFFLKPMARFDERN